MSQLWTRPENGKTVIQDGFGHLIWKISETLCFRIPSGNLKKLDI